MRYLALVRWTVTLLCLVCVIAPSRADGQTTLTFKRTIVTKTGSEADQPAAAPDQNPGQVGGAVVAPGAPQRDVRGDVIPGLVLDPSGSVARNRTPWPCPAPPASAESQGVPAPRRTTAWFPEDTRNWDGGQGPSRVQRVSGVSPAGPERAFPSREPLPKAGNGAFPTGAARVEPSAVWQAAVPPPKKTASEPDLVPALPGAKNGEAVVPLPALPGAKNGQRAEPVPAPPGGKNGGLLQPVPAPPEVPDKAEVFRSGPFEVFGHEDKLTVILRRSKLLRSQTDIARTAVVDSSVCDVVQFSPREVSIIGKGQGATDVTFWFQDPNMQPRTYLVYVTPDPEVKKRREETFKMLEDIIAKLFPNSKVKLIPIGDKLLVTGQARDAEEAAEILAVIRGEIVTQEGYWYSGHLVSGTAQGPLTTEETNRSVAGSQVINMLKIPGVHQVALRVKIAELNRSAARSFGVDVDMMFKWADGTILLESLMNIGKGRSILGSFDHEKLNFGIHFLEKHGVVRMLSEPTLVTLSGRPASFVAGGEFAVPTVVGVGGASAVTTDFRAFGAVITFLPIVLDKDRIRLEVSPEFSKINSSLSVGGTPGLDTRAVTTTVEMREGQTLAIAGLLDDGMKNDTAGDLPLVTQIFGTRSASREEHELIILVTPELVHPMEPEEVPPLPGFDVTEPNNFQFYLKGYIEGRPTDEYRSTVWPRLRHRYNSGGSAMISGPFGHGN